MLTLVGISLLCHAGHLQRTISKLDSTASAPPCERYFTFMHFVIMQSIQHAGVLSQQNLLSMEK